MEPTIVEAMAVDAVLGHIATVHDTKIRDWLATVCETHHELANALHEFWYAVQIVKLDEESHRKRVRNDDLVEHQNEAAIDGKELKTDLLDDLIDPQLKMVGAGT